MLEKYHHKDHTFLHSFERHADIHWLAFMFIMFSIIALLLAFQGVRGATSSNFTMTILPQPLAVNIIDADFNIIEEPEVAFTELDYTEECREIRTPLISDSQQLYIRNFDAADGGWTVTISTDDPTVLWTQGDYQFDFNDPTGDGCVDGSDADEFAGSMEIYTESPALNSGLCPVCSTDDVHHVSG